MSQAPGIFAANSSQDLSATLAATTSTAEIIIGNGGLVAITATGAVCIRFGNSGMAAASASNFQVPANSVAMYSLGDHQDRLRLYNPGGAPITYFIQTLEMD